MKTLKIIMTISLIIIGIAISFNLGYLMGWRDEYYFDEIYEMSLMYTTLVDIEKGNVAEIQNKFGRDIERKVEEINPEETFFEYMMSQGFLSFLSATFGITDLYPSCFDHFDVGEKTAKCLTMTYNNYRKIGGTQGERE